jgi:hypothetical protein
VILHGGNWIPKRHRRLKKTMTRVRSILARSKQIDKPDRHVVRLGAGYSFNVQTHQIQTAFKESES